MKQKLQIMLALLLTMCTSALAQSFPKESTATETHWYTIKGMKQGHYLYAPTTAYTSAGGDKTTAYHISTASAMSNTSYWKFVKRSDGKWNIIPNYAGVVYATPTTTKNYSIKVLPTEPSEGWTVAAASTAGQYIIYSGTIYQWHQTTASNGWTNNTIIYWNNGSLVTNDAAYCYQIEEVDASEVRPIMYRDQPIASIGELTTGWYQIAKGSNFAQTGTETLSGGNYYPLHTTSDPAASEASSYVYIEKNGNSVYFQSPNGHYLNKAAATTTKTAMPGFAFAAGASGEYTSTFTINGGTGTPTQYNGTDVTGNTSTYFKTWTSKTSNPTLLLYQGVKGAAAGNNIQLSNATTGGLYLFSGNSMASTEYTLEVPTGYIITGYKMVFNNRVSNSYSQIRVTPAAGGSAVTASRSSTASVTLTTSGLSSTTAKFTLQNQRSTTNVNRGQILVTTFEVYVERDESAAIPQAQLPWEVSGTQIINASSANDWTIYEPKMLAENYDIYQVSIVNAPDASATLNSKAQAIFTGAHGLTAVYDKGYFFVEKGQILTGAEISGTEYENYTTSAVADTEAKTIVLTYKEYEPIVDDDAVSVTVFDGPNSPTPSTSTPATNANNTTYRIPTIAKLSNGELLAVSDRRYHLSDVGCSGAQMELVYRHSSDGGATWTGEQVICAKSNSTSDWKYAMGDAAMVADRESGNVLVYCAAGNVGNANSTASNRIKIGCFRSTDNGHTWDSGTNVTSQMYGIFSEVTATAMFITSGKMFQSRYVKVGDYYRIYAAFPLRTSKMGNGTHVIFSDDFGQTWSPLGSATAFPTTNYEEAKIEELPDGSVMLMVRDDNGATSTTAGHRNFNIFTYTDSYAGQGYWSSAVSGITGMMNACNDAIIIVPAQRSSDGEQVYVAVTTIPFYDKNADRATDNYGRRNLGFYYKEIANADDYISGAALAAGWAKGEQISTLFSAYSEAVLLDNGYIGLLYEDNGKHGSGKDSSGGTNANTEAYDIVFSSFSLERITKGNYTYDEAFTDRTSYFDSSLEKRVGGTVGKAVGMIGDNYAYYNGDKTQENMEELQNDSYNNTLRVNEIIEDRPYYIRSTQTTFGGTNHGTTFLSTDRSTLTAVSREAGEIGDVFTFKKSGSNWKLYSMNNEVFATATPASTSNKVGVSESEGSAETFAVTSYNDGYSCIVSQNPGTSGQGGLNISGGYFITGWKYDKTNNPGSFYYIEPIEEWSVTFNKASNDATEAYSTLYLPFSTSLPDGVQAYTISDLGNGTAEAVEIGNIPALTPVILKRGGDGGNVTFEVPPVQYENTGLTNMLLGTLRDKTVEDRDKTYVLSAKDGHVGFYHLKSSVNTLKGNRAYLYQTSNSAPSFILNFGGATSVELVRQNDEGGKWYDLSGRRVAAPKNAGVYIKNGKKVLVK